MTNQRHIRDVSLEWIIALGGKKADKEENYKNIKRSRQQRKLQKQVENIVIQKKNYKKDIFEEEYRKKKDKLFGQTKHAVVQSFKKWGKYKAVKFKGSV